MLSLPGGDEGNEKQQVVFDAWGRQESLLREMAALTERLSLSTLSLVPPSRSLRTSVWALLLRAAGCERGWRDILQLRQDHTGVYLALDLPRFGDGRQVARSHHHGPGNTTHDSDL